VSDSRWGGATAEHEAHGLLVNLGGIVCGYQIVVVCEFNLLQYVFYLKCQVAELIPVCRSMM